MHNHQNPSHFSEIGFWEKIKSTAKKAGKALITQALELYYIAKDPQTPTWAKTTIYGGLAYFILPIDVIPDFLGAVGFTDDATVLATVWQTIKQFARPHHSEQAQQKFNDWFE